MFNRRVNSYEWALLAAKIVDYTDGEVSEKILAFLSYLLPDRIELLSLLFDADKNITYKIAAIVDPSPELRLDIDNPCLRFNRIYSNLNIERQRKINEFEQTLLKIVNGNLDYYNCKIE
ncbi:hypothetical protein [Gynuella sunshinyii]|uniref:Uncharacterized protein n=1 Tax=Gynuella sunshinyii YC6258 TaxID=1445510 RepID=A0A0C5V3P5_9GAMM|nr:hypothetical protein [Gynuella sunshinyii]AJQ94120.1 hypothetical Protein YC6258_02078 [Gynuella sunshinyii YC6258]